VRIEDTLRLKEERSILHTIRRRKTNWIVHILDRNCLLKDVIEGNIEGRAEVTRRRGRKLKQAREKEKTGY
jgi:hypothetical protein